MNNYNLITSFNQLGITLNNSDQKNFSTNTVNYQNYTFEIKINFPITFFNLSKLFSEKFIIDLACFTKIPIVYPGTKNIIHQNWIKPINLNMVLPFFLSKYIQQINNKPNQNPLIKTKNKSTGPKKSRKKTIPIALKRKVWDHWIGEQIGKTKCPCCKLTDITQLNFSCGHILAEANGGSLNVSNLRPICTSCNSSMGTKNMNEFIREYGL